MSEREKPRSILFHWTANMFFAGVAIAGGAAFGERISQQTLRWLIPAVVFGALALVPLTRRWEAGAITKRAAERSEPGEDSVDPPE